MSNEKSGDTNTESQGAPVVAPVEAPVETPKASVMTSGRSDAVMWCAFVMAAIAMVSQVVLWGKSRENDPQPAPVIRVLDIEHMMGVLKDAGYDSAARVAYIDRFLAVANAEGAVVLDNKAVMSAPQEWIISAYPSQASLDRLLAEYGITPNDARVEQILSEGRSAVKRVDDALSAMGLSANN